MTIEHVVFYLQFGSGEGLETITWREGRCNCNQQTYGSKDWPRCLNVMEISLPPLLRHRNPDFEPLIPNSRVFEAFEGFFKFERIFNHPHPLIQYPSSFWGSSCCFGVINLLPTCAPVFFRMSVVCFCAHKWASLKLNRYWLAWCRPTPRPGGSAPGLLNLDMWFKYISISPDITKRYPKDIPLIPPFYSMVKYAALARS